MGPKFFCVIGNRDHLKIKTAAGITKEPIWKFIQNQEQWLTSLAYAKGVQAPPGGRFFDCGAWSYKHEPLPRWSPEQCVEMYRQYARTGDLVASPDHMVLRGHDRAEEAKRIDITLRNAREFIRLCPPEWVPVGVTHGHSAKARRYMAFRLLKMGYRYLAVGGVAGIAGSRKKVTEYIEAAMHYRGRSEYKVHVLGVSALSWMPAYRDLGVDTYDGSAMFYAAFTGATYYWADGPKIIKYSVKELGPDKIPLCHCLACTAMREQGDDTRTMGSNERNMGRAVHNINMYLEVLKWCG